MADDFNFELITLNVRGLRDFKKRRKIFNWIKKHTSKESIMLLQETHSDEKVENIWTSQWHGDLRFSHGTNLAKGCLIGFGENLHYSVTKEYKDNEGRFLMIECSIQDQPFLIINLYNPNTESEQVRVIEDLEKLIDTIDSDHAYQMILGGDFNFIFDVNLDSNGGNSKLKLSSIRAITSLTNTRDLVDIWRTRNPELRRFTFRQPNPLIQRRLDHLFISNSLQENVEVIDIIPAVSTDHSAIFMKMSSVKSAQHGPSHWKFNNSLTLDSVFVEMLRKEITTVLKNYSSTFSDPRVKWEFLKYRIRLTTKEYASKRSKERKKMREDLESKVNELENKITADSDEQTILQYEKCRSELEAMYDHITQGIILRSKVTWYEKGEKSNKYFLNLERRNSSKTHVKKLIEYDALKSMPSNKSPGNDGLSKEFYLCFFDLLGQPLLDCLNFSYEKGELPASQRQAVITLIEKKGKDKRFIKNWRPISLINVDTKVLSKSIAISIKKVIRTVVSNDQTAYVPGRHIGESVRLISDLLEYTDTHDIPGFMITADIEKPSIRLNTIL